MIGQKGEKDGKIKKWEHIAVRPPTFFEFRDLKGYYYETDDAFLQDLLRLYSKRLYPKKLGGKNGVVQPKTK